MDRKKSFLFAGDVNSNAARDCTSSPGCEQMVTEPTYNDGKVIYLVLIDVPDVVGVRFGSHVGTSDHSAVFIDVVRNNSSLGM